MWLDVAMSRKRNLLGCLRPCENLVLVALELMGQSIDSENVWG